VSVNVELPDTITDWVATGYALNAETGIGVALAPANVRNLGFNSFLMKSCQLIQLLINYQTILDIVIM